ncbi:MAG: phenylalanine--tRNA ligase subunit alpha [Gemmatimonadales bacterium]
MSDLLAALDALRERLHEIPQADDRRLPELKTELLGRKAGALTAILRALPTLDPETRKTVGNAANALKRELEDALAARERVLSRAARERAGGVGEGGADLTMPGRAAWRGGLHLVTQVVDEICDIFRELGFTRAVGPEAETERYNFYALNFPKDHPALDAQDSFYLGDDVVLRTHTSPVQIRTLERYPPPIRVVIPGQCYRRDPFDASHSPVFEQIEGLAVDEGLTFVDLKATLTTFARRFFTSDTPVRFQPSYFPFTEPSAEMYVGCRICQGAGCSTCKQTGWMEILGSGMVHPAVLENCGVDAERYTGFAWGMGPQRIAMTRHGIPDIRLFFESDMRFLRQFAEGSSVVSSQPSDRQLTTDNRELK